MVGYERGQADSPNANGAGIAASPTRACLGSGRVGRPPFPGVLRGRSTLAVPCGTRSGQFRQLLPSPAVLPLTSPEVPKNRRSSPGVSVPAWWSRQAVVPARKPFPPPGGSATASSLACRDFHSAAPKRGFPVVRSGRPEAVIQPCASRCICGSLGGSEECAKRVFRYCCGHRRWSLKVSVFPFNSAVSRWIFKFAFSLSMT